MALFYHKSRIFSTYFLTFCQILQKKFGFSAHSHAFFSISGEAVFAAFSQHHCGASFPHPRRGAFAPRPYCGASTPHPYHGASSSHLTTQYSPRTTVRQRRKASFFPRKTPLKKFLIFFKKPVDKTNAKRYNNQALSDAELCKGSTTDSDSVCLGSNPSSATMLSSSTIAAALFSGCGSAGRVLRSGRKGREFEPRHSDQNKKAHNQGKKPVVMGFFMFLPPALCFKKLRKNA